MKSIRQVLWLAVAVAVTACGGSETGGNSTAGGDAPASPPAAAETTNSSVEIVPGLTMRILNEGTGAAAEVGHVAVVHYTGWLYDESAADNRGEKFDSSVDRNRHFEFPLGGGRVIRGWDQGVVGMAIGEVRELTIAPDLAYGDRQVGGLIPPGSTLVFEVELADLKGSDGISINAPQ